MRCLHRFTPRLGVPAPMTHLWASLSLKSLPSVYLLCFRIKDSLIFGESQKSPSLNDSLRSPVLKEASFPRAPLPQWEDPGCWKSSSPLSDWFSQESPTRKRGVRAVCSTELPNLGDPGTLGPCLTPGIDMCHIPTGFLWTTEGTLAVFQACVFWP